MANYFQGCNVKTSTRIAAVNSKDFTATTTTKVVGNDAEVTVTLAASTDNTQADLASITSVSGAVLTDTTTGTPVSVTIAATTNSVGGEVVLEFIDYPMSASNEVGDWTLTFASMVAVGRDGKTITIPGTGKSITISNPLANLVP